MNRLQKRMASAVASAALLANLALPALAGTTTLEISGNGRDTDNDANVQVTNTTTVVQSNEADIDNDISVNSNTGDNRANDNFGGNVEIDTGDVDAKVGVSNTANSNVADVDGCCEQDVDVKIHGNRRDSDNEVDLKSTTQTGLFQSNEADVENEVDVNSNTGRNRANDNSGDVLIETGDVDVDSIDITNSLNSNSARIGGNGGGLSLSARIVGNGRNTDNDIDLEVQRSIILTQDNEADVENDVDVNSNTGDNKANDNLGGEVEIDTGDVDVEVSLDTMANFNAADVECDCLGDVWAKLAENGRDSENDIAAVLASDLNVFQNNCGDSAQAVGYTGDGGDCEIDNTVDANSTTGRNDANDNGGDDDSDPLIETGNVDVEASATTTGNSNVYGDAHAADFEFPAFGFNLNLSLDLGDLLDALGL